MEFEKLAFVGGGAMAEAIIRGVVARELTSPNRIWVGEPIAGRREALRATLGVAATADNGVAVADADVVVLAVKPQHASSVLPGLKGAIRPGQTVVSIVAGLTIGNLTAALGHEGIVRVMPNTPAQVGEGMSVWAATPTVAADAKRRVQLLLAALGREIEMPAEHYLDMATALNGSGPGYVFLFLEALIDAGVGLGFSRQVAEELTYQTVLGSVVMARESGKHPAELRNMVTSPAGTTAAGLRELEEGRLRAIVDRAVRAAYARCVELGQK